LARLPKELIEDALIYSTHPGRSLPQRS